MATVTNDTPLNLLKDVKKAIQRAQEQLDQHNIEISKLDIEIKTAFTKSAGGKLKLSVIPLELSGNYTTTDVQTLSLSLLPRESPVELLGGVQDELTHAIELINSTVEEALTSEPVFDLSSAMINLNFGVTKNGKISVIAGTKGGRERTHTVKLTLKRRASR